jgi:hypothetical protein
MGLGNRLYPWARCHVFSVQQGVPMLAPRWWWPPRVRPLLKEIPPAVEFPGHLYVRGMRALPEYIGGARRMLIEATSPGDINVFRGEGVRLQDLHGHEDLLHHALRRISTARPSLPAKYIAMHVRRGDFSDAARTPLEWFVSALRAVRNATSPAVPAVIVSDGLERDLSVLRNEPNVQLVRTHVPLGDLLVLAAGRVLLASGSSFSAWASFLGGMPTVAQPGHSMEWFGVRARSFIGHFDPRANNDAFLHAVANSVEPTHFC